MQRGAIDDSWNGRMRTRAFPLLPYTRTRAHSARRVSAHPICFFLFARTLPLCVCVCSDTPDKCYSTCHSLKSPSGSGAAAALTHCTPPGTDLCHKFFGPTATSGRHIFRALIRTWSEKQRWILRVCARICLRASAHLLDRCASAPALSVCLLCRQPEISVGIGWNQPRSLRERSMVRTERR